MKVNYLYKNYSPKMFNKNKKILKSILNYLLNKRKLLQ